MKLFTHYISVALIALFLIGARCAHVERPYQAPDAETIKIVLQKRMATFSSIRGEAKMSYKIPNGKVKATVRMMAERGHKLRFDVVSPFDTPLSTLQSNGKNFLLIDAKKNKRYHGPATPCNLSRLLRVGLKAEDIRLILAGFTPLIDHQQTKLSWDSVQGVEVLYLRGRHFEQIIKLDGRDKSWPILSSEIKKLKGETILILHMNDHQWIKNDKFHEKMPRTITIEQPMQNALLDLSFKSREINIDLPQIAFSLPTDPAELGQYVDCNTVIK